MLVVAVAAMLFPAIFHFTYHWHDPALFEQHEHGISFGTSVILLIGLRAGPALHAADARAPVLPPRRRESRKTRRASAACTASDWSSKRA